MKRSTFGSELRRLRGEAELTMADLAEAIECSVVYISDIERSRRNPPTPKKILKLLKVLNKEDALDEMLQLAMRDRKTVEIKNSSSEVSAMLAALARRADDGSLSNDVAKQIKKLLESSDDS